MDMHNTCSPNTIPEFPELIQHMFARHATFSVDGKQSYDVPHIFPVKVPLFEHGIVQHSESRHATRSVEFLLYGSHCESDVHACAIQSPPFTHRKLVARTENLLVNRRQ
ncbi:unnamed protein product [Onchocerca ochengi]|uniref:PITH domain-containing protein n=1 Tax=Onchocerca ochengi TaxID=42157 RepID=A0A182EK55_ONCOC|nr:unnamed protein product [Onchocerca ochengi]